MRRDYWGDSQQPQLQHRWAVPSLGSQEVGNYASGPTLGSEEPRKKPVTPTTITAGFHDAARCCMATAPFIRCTPAGGLGEQVPNDSWPNDISVAHTAA